MKIVEALQAGGTGKGAPGSALTFTDFLVLVTKIFVEPSAEPEAK